MNNEYFLFLISVVFHETSNDAWILDSACSNHMIGNIDLISNLDESIIKKSKLCIDSIADV